MQTQALRTSSLPQLSQRHAVAIGFVALLHVALVYALINMGVIDVVLAPPPDHITNVILDPPTTPPPPPPTKNVRPVDNRIFIPEPTVSYQENEPGETALTGQRTNIAPPPEIPVTVMRAQGIGYTHTEPPYPLPSIKLNEQGTVSLRLTISEAGDVVGVTVLRSSGYARLDQAAVIHVKAHWRYHPAMRGGQPVASSVDAQLKFELKGR